MRYNFGVVEANFLPKGTAMLNRVLLAGLVLAACNLPALSADESCTPKSEKPAELIRAIACLQKRVIVLEERDTKSFEARVKALEEGAKTAVKIGDSVKLGFDAARCLSAPSGVSGSVLGLSPAIDGRLLTLLQDCNGSPPMTLRR